MVTQNATPVVAPVPKKRGRPPGVKNKPKVKAKGGRKKGQTKTDLPRTARAYMRQAMGLSFPTESAAIAELIMADDRLHRDYDHLWNSVENMGEAEEVKLSGFRQFFVNMFAGQPVKVFAK